MKLTKSQLKQIIKEELGSTIEEYGIDRFGPAAKGHREAAEVEKNPANYMTKTFENAEQLKAYIQGRIDKMPDIDQTKKSHIRTALEHIDREELSNNDKMYEITPISLALGIMNALKIPNAQGGSWGIYTFKNNLKKLSLGNAEDLTDLADIFHKAPEGWKPEYAPIAGGVGGAYMVNENKLKLTKQQLKQVIKEELKKVLNETHAPIGKDSPPLSLSDMLPQTETGGLGNLLNQVLDISNNVERASEFAEADPELLDIVVKSSQFAIITMYKSIQDQEQQKRFIEFVKENTPEQIWPKAATQHELKL